MDDTLLSRGELVRRAAVAGAGVVAAGTLAGRATAAPRRRGAATPPVVTQILGRPTDRTVALNVLSSADIDVYAEFGASAAKLSARTPTARARAGAPLVLELKGLAADTGYAYRLRLRRPGQAPFTTGALHGFRTQRATGSSFTFTLQGDSHPERVGKMFEEGLYARTMRNIAADRPDFHLAIGDDFSIDRLIQRGTLSRETVEQVYAYQRAFLGTVGASSPVFLVNGNHEQAGMAQLDGTPTSSPVLAGAARTRFYALPAPDGFFYTGDAREVEHLGLPRDYYAWTWGDAVFVVLDAYWHSPVLVDADPSAGGGKKAGTKQAAALPGIGTTTDAQPAAGGGKQRDWWGITIGNEQYAWLKETLEGSTARHRFVFIHHVLGTGRGGVELAGNYEWGGGDPSGAATFKARRPGWELPIHQLLVKNRVSVLFLGHDHLYARQELDGVVYQQTPVPADPTFTAFNRDAYTSGVVHPNTGYLRVGVTPAAARVEYVRSLLPKDETAGKRNGQVVHAYSVRAKA